jgi:hypothetical protein
MRINPHLIFIKRGTFAENAAYVERPGGDTHI